MALSTHAGNFALPVGTGQFTPVSDIPFEPKLVIFFWNVRTADGSTIHFRQGHGAAVSSSNRFCQWGVDTNAVANSVNASGSSDALCFIATGNTGTILSAADFVSMNANGFTLNLTTADGLARIINYIAYGGDDLTNVTIAKLASPTATGNQAYTGVGFQPEAALFFSPDVTTPQTSSSFKLMVGMATATAQGVAAVEGTNGQATMDTNHGQLTTHCVLTHGAAAAVRIRASLVSFDADGLTLNFDDIEAAARDIFAICFKGGLYKVGELAQKTSTGTQARTGIGFQPTGLFLASCNDASDSTGEAHARLSVGAASGASNRGSVWAGSTDNVADAICDTDLDTASMLRMLTEGTPTQDAEVDLDSFDVDGWTEDWVIADATARLYLYFAVGSNQTAAITGTITSGTVEADIVAGGKTIIITLHNDAWVAAGATFDAIRQDIIDGLDSAQSEATGWNAEVRDKEAVTAVVRTSDTVVTITLSAAAAYNITAQEIITVTVPATAVAKGEAITGSPTVAVSIPGSGRSMHHYRMRRAA